MPHTCRLARLLAPIDIGQKQSDLLIIFLRKRADLIWFTIVQRASNYFIASEQLACQSMVNEH